MTDSNDNYTPTDERGWFPLPAVELFVKAVGYPSETNTTRYVAVYWGGGDEAYWDDGMSSATGEWGAYLLYVDHPTVRPNIQDRWSLGSSEEPATHYLVIDRQESKGQVMPVKAALELLQSQFEAGETEVVEMTPEQFKAWLDDLTEQIEEHNAQWAAMSNDEVMAMVDVRLAEQYQLEEDLRVALEEANHPDNN